MKKYIQKLLLVTVLTVLSVPASLVGQAIVTDPAFPAEDKPLRITFDVSETERNDLEGFSGDIYVHTGVILTESDKNSGSWEYVIADWPVDIPRAKLAPLGDDQWELQIDDIRSYYELPDSEGEVLQLAFVLRNSPGSLQTENLYIDLYDDELQVRFTKPVSDDLNLFFAENGQRIDFEINGSSELGTLSSITLLQGETVINSTSDANSLTATYSVTGSGRINIYAVAEDQQGTEARDTLSIVINPDVVMQPSPRGIEDGITYHESDPGKVTLSFFAPEKEFAYVIGSFSDWEVQDEYYMKLDEARADSAHFWIEINGLQAGEQHTFQYLIDGEVRVADLYSELVLDPDFDQFIPESIYPNLPEYPTGLTREIVSVIETGQTDYQWQAPDFERPAKEELVIYELLLRDFLEESSFATLRDTLSYLENLGVNAIELMPVSQFDGNISWGYNPTFHGALEKSYGTRQAFKEFIDEAHQRGLAVILDVVYNHAHEKSPLIRTFGSTQAENPFIGPGHAYNVFNHLNHNNSYIKYWLDRMNRHWLEEYNIDGYRFDLSKGFASNVDNQSLLDGRNEPRIENLKRMADEIWDYDPEAYVILEHFADNSEEIELSDYGMMLWGNHNHNYSQASMGYAQESNFSGIHFANRGWSNPHLVGYMESHDEQWIMLKNRKFGNDSSPDYEVTDFNTAIDRQKLTGSFFLTIPGPKMLWQFGELGYGWGEEECLKPGNGGSGDCTPSDPGRVDPKPIRWEYISNPVRNNLYRTWSELLRLRNSSPVFTSAETQFSSSLSGTINWVKLLHDDMNAVIVGNFGVFGETASIPFPESGIWYDFVSGDELGVAQTNQTVDMMPGEVRIYTSQDVPASEEGVFVSNENSEGSDIPENFRLLQNYPNPFNPTTMISYDISQASQVQLNVYDALGREVATLVKRENHPAGTFSVTFDASQLSSGIYFTRLKSGELTRIQKMSLIK